MLLPKTIGKLFVTILKLFFFLKFFQILQKSSIFEPFNKRSHSKINVERMVNCQPSSRAEDSQNSRMKNLEILFACQNIQKSFWDHAASLQKIENSQKYSIVDPWVKKLLRCFTLTFIDDFPNLPLHSSLNIQFKTWLELPSDMNLFDI